MTPFEQLGGEAGLRALVVELVSRMAGDFVIGFQFEGKDLERIAHHEYALAAAHLGGPNAYGGRSLSEAHRPLRINRGQFRRRLSILRNLLEQRGAPAEAVEAWIAAESALEDAIAMPTDCAPPR